MNNLLGVPKYIRCQAAKDNEASHHHQVFNSQFSAFIFFSIFLSDTCTGYSSKHSFYLSQSNIFQSFTLNHQICFPNSSSLLLQLPLSWLATARSQSLYVACSFTKNQANWSRLVMLVETLPLLGYKGAWFPALERTPRLRLILPSSTN